VTVPFPIPDDPWLGELVKKWEEGDGYSFLPFPRSSWLRAVEDVLRRHYPGASSDELTLTARNLAPFPLAKPGVP
jgi:hypothetical protein